jgi:hypothetical protein
MPATAEFVTTATRGLPLGHSPRGLVTTVDAPTVQLLAVLTVEKGQDLAPESRAREPGNAGAALGGGLR